MEQQGWDQFIKDGEERYRELERLWKLEQQHQHELYRLSVGDTLGDRMYQLQESDTSALDGILFLSYLCHLSYLYIRYECDR
jgi:predicted NACHT family NTPase